MTTKQSSPITPQLITNVILPAAVLVGAAGYFHPPWLPYAVALAVGIGGLHFIVPASADAIADQPVSKQKTANATLSNAAPAIEVVEEEKERLPLDPEVFQEYPLIEKTVLSHNTAIYRFKLLKEDATLGLPIGQHISLAATLDVKDQKTGEVVRKEVIRSYTPVSSENEPGYFDLLIKSYPQGNLSRHFAELKIGDTMKVKGPKGAMVYTPNMNKHIGMIAGGSGITPMLQVARAIVRGRGKGDTTRVDLIFANVDEKDILLREDLDKLAREDDKFNVYYVLNNPPAGWTGGSGFVTPEMIKEHFPAPSKDNKVLICGPPPMVSAMKKATESLGFEKARIVSKLPDQVFCF